MTCTLLIPNAGLMELWPSSYPKTGTEVLTEKDLGNGLVQIDLHSDSEMIGRAVWNIAVEAAVNVRAQAAVAYLIGAQVQITGPCVLEGLSEQQAVEIMRDVAA